MFPFSFLRLAFVSQPSPEKEKPTKIPSTINPGRLKKQHKRVLKPFKKSASMASPSPPNVIGRPGTQPEATKNTNSKQRKRKLGEDVDIRDSAYFKLRALVRHLRPHFIEVLRTPDFQKCKAATEIQNGMRLVMDYYRQMLTEGNKRGKIEMSPCQPASAEHVQGKEHLHKQLQEEKQKVHHQAKQVTKKTVKKKLSPPPFSWNKLESGRLQEYIVGGSVSGWNFITFTNKAPPLYYGVTKESHRSSWRNS